MYIMHKKFFSFLFLFFLFPSSGSGRLLSGPLSIANPFDQRVLSADNVTNRTGITMRRDDPRLEWTPWLVEQIIAATPRRPRFEYARDCLSFTRLIKFERAAQKEASPLSSPDDKFPEEVTFATEVSIP